LPRLLLCRIGEHARAHVAAAGAGDRRRRWPDDVAAR
jgi:hypothetical protein